MESSVLTGKLPLIFKGMFLQSTMVVPRIGIFWIIYFGSHGEIFEKLVTMKVAGLTTPPADCF